MAAGFSMEVFDNEVVPSSLSSISPVLRAAAEIEAERPRVAYLCESSSSPLEPPSCYFTSTFSSYYYYYLIIIYYC